jgi:hypothetical protein
MMVFFIAFPFNGRRLAAAPWLRRAIRRNVNLHNSGKLRPAKRNQCRLAHGWAVWRAGRTSASKVRSAPGGEPASRQAASSTVT